MELKYLLLSLTLSHQLPHKPQNPPTHTQTHRTSWFCITGRQKVILARLANLCERPLWLCRIKPSALILFYRSSSEVLPVLGGSSWRDGICQPFVSSHVSCSLLCCTNYMNGLLPSYLQISGSSSVTTLMPQWALQIRIHSGICVELQSWAQARRFRRTFKHELWGPSLLS